MFDGLLRAIFRIAIALWVADERDAARKFTAVCCVGVLLIVAIAWWVLR